MKVSRVVKATIDILVTVSIAVTILCMIMCVYTIFNTKLDESSNWIQLMYMYSFLMIIGSLSSFYLRQSKHAIEVILPVVIISLLVTRFDKAAYNEVSSIMQGCMSLNDFVEAINITYLF